MEINTKVSGFINCFFWCFFWFFIVFLSTKLFLIFKVFIPAGMKFYINDLDVIILGGSALLFFFSAVLERRLFFVEEMIAEIREAESMLDLAERGQVDISREQIRHKRKTYFVADLSVRKEEVTEALKEVLAARQKSFSKSLFRPLYQFLKKRL